MRNLQQIINSGVIEAYLLEMLSPADKLAFEQALADLPALRAELLIRELLLSAPNQPGDTMEPPDLRFLW